MRIRLVAGSVFVFLAVSASSAQTPLSNAFTYQGQLKNGGSPASGSFNVVFKLWNDPTLSAPANQVGPTLTFDGVGGNPPLVSVTNGLFTVQLDFGATAFDGSKRWLSIVVSGTTLTPRQEMTAAPNALFASNADLLSGLPVSSFLQSVPVPLTLIGTSNSQIIEGRNNSNNSGTAGVTGSSTAASGDTFGLWGVSLSSSGRAVYGQSIASNGAAYGVYGESASTAGLGVYGLATATSGATYGVSGESNSVVGYGVLGAANATSGLNYGVYGRTNSTSGRGVYGEALSTDGLNFGVFGYSASMDGRGVCGLAGNTSVGFAYGGFFQSEGFDGKGVYAVATATGTGISNGVYGESRSNRGTGVWGVCHGTPSGAGVRGDGGDVGVLAYGGRYGVLASGDPWGVFSYGDFYATGTKSFCIDHPSDPLNKYLISYTTAPRGRNPETSTRATLPPGRRALRGSHCPTTSARSIAIPSIS